MTSTSNRCGLRTSSRASRSISISSKATAGWLAATVAAVSRNRPSVLRITVALCAAVTRLRPFAAAYRNAKSNTRSAARRESGLSEMPLSELDCLSAAREPRAQLACSLAADVELDAAVEPLGRLADDDDIDTRRGRRHAGARIANAAPGRRGRARGEGRRWRTGTSIRSASRTGPFSATPASRMAATTWSGTESPNRSCAGAPSTSGIHSMFAPLASITARATDVTSGPMPSPGMMTTGVAAAADCGDPSVGIAAVYSAAVPAGHVRLTDPGQDTVVVRAVL